MIRIGIIGAGFVGATHAQAFAEEGFDIKVYDINKKYYERFPQFDRLPKISSFNEVIGESEIIYICLPTPPYFYGENGECGECNTDIVEEILGEIDDRALTGGCIDICIKSTIPVGRTLECSRTYNNLNLHYSPEFLTEAMSLNDLKNASRIVIGYNYNGGQLCGNIMYSLEAINKNEDCHIIVCSTSEAELIKLSSNSFLAMKVGFANFVYDMAEKHKMDYTNVRIGMGTDVRIGPSHLKVPGIDGKRGFSGSCFPKDIGNLISCAEEVNVNCKFLKNIEKRNIETRNDSDWIDNKYRKKQ